MTTSDNSNPVSREQLAWYNFSVGLALALKEQCQQIKASRFRSCLDCSACMNGTGCDYATEPSEWDLGKLPEKPQTEAELIAACNALSEIEKEKPTEPKNSNDGVVRIKK